MSIAGNRANHSSTSAYVRLSGLLLITRLSVAIRPVQKSRVISMGRAAVWLAIAGMMLGGATAGAQTSGRDTGAAMPMMEGMHAIPPPEQLPRPIRMTGIGNAISRSRPMPKRRPGSTRDSACCTTSGIMNRQRRSSRPFGRSHVRDVLLGAGAGGRYAWRSKKYYGDRALAGRCAEGQSEREGQAVYRGGRDRVGRGGTARTRRSIAIYRKLVKKQPQDIEARIYLANAVGDGFDNHGDPKPGRRRDRDS